MLILRWGVAAQRFGISSRQYGKKFPGCLRSKARPSLSLKALVFFYMIKHYLSQVSIVTLLICLCMGSLVALPMDNLAGISGLELFEIEIENDNRADDLKKK